MVTPKAIFQNFQLNTFTSRHTEKSSPKESFVNAVHTKIPRNFGKMPKICPKAPKNALKCPKMPDKMPDKMPEKCPENARKMPEEMPENA